MLQQVLNTVSSVCAQPTQNCRRLWTRPIPTTHYSQKCNPLPVPPAPKEEYEVFQAKLPHEGWPEVHVGCPDIDEIPGDGVDCTWCLQIVAIGLVEEIDVGVWIVAVGIVEEIDVGV